MERSRDSRVRPFITTYCSVAFCGSVFALVWIYLYLTTTFMEQLNTWLCAFSPYSNCWSILTWAGKYEEPHPLLSRAAVPILYRFMVNFKPCANSSHCCERKTRFLSVVLVARFSSSWLRTLQRLKVTIRRIYLTGRKETQFIEFASRFIWTKETTNWINDSLKKCLA